MAIMALASLYGFVAVAFDVHGCFNKQLWDPNVGKEFDVTAAKKIWSELTHPYIKHLSILGGEPLCKWNYETTLLLCKTTKALFPNKKTFLWSGFELDYIKAERSEILDYIDMLVSGPFMEDLKCLDDPLRGSSNQVVTFFRH